MKKFFTAIPLQPQGKLGQYVYSPVGNKRLGMTKATRFPIVPAIRGYVTRGEEFRVIAVMTDNNDCRHNLGLLKDELNAVCADTEAVCPKGVELVTVAADDRVSAHVATFQKLIGFAENDDELFACMTFGTKPMSQVLLMAVQYAYRVKKNTSIDCIVYGQIDRSVNPAAAKIYDMTALLQLDEIVRSLAERGVENPKEIIDKILSL